MRGKPTGNTKTDDAAAPAVNGIVEGRYGIPSGLPADDVHPWSCGDTRLETETYECNDRASAAQFLSSKKVRVRGNAHISVAESQLDHIHGPA
jgi:hypothetical protein